MSGYGTCATTLIGRQRESDDPHVLRRLPVNEADDSALLLAKVAGAYDWLAPAQRVVKRIKRIAPQVKRSQKAGTGGAGGKF
ncbi:MAG: hypothetical protein HUU41_23090 [Bryobacteraceae bacterium]|nr:hypothetical protein [Bryobacteraceae bacterium]